MAKILSQEERELNEIRDAAEVGFRDRLMAIIEHRKINQNELGPLVGVRSSGSWSRWFNNPPETFPNYLAVHQLGERLGINLNWLVLGESTEPMLRADRLPLTAAAESVRMDVLRRISQERHINSTAEQSVPRGEAFIEFVAEAVRARLPVL